MEQQLRHVTILWVVYLYGMDNLAHKGPLWIYRANADRCVHVIEADVIHVLH